MKESIGSRVSRLIAGSVNKVLDAFENSAPEMVMEQALRELDGTLHDVRAELGRALAAKHHASKRMLAESERHDALAEQVEMAVGNGREDLAEAAIARQFDIEAQLPILEAAISDAAARQKELEGFVAALAARRRELEDELMQYRAAQKAGIAEPLRRPRSAEAAHGRALVAQEQAEAQASEEYDAAAATPMFAARLAELDALARRNRIRERLEQIKAKNGK